MSKGEIGGAVNWKDKSILFCYLVLLRPCNQTVISNKGLTICVGQGLLPKKKFRQGFDNLCWSDIFAPPWIQSVDARARD